MSTVRSPYLVGWAREGATVHLVNLTLSQLLEVGRTSRGENVRHLDFPISSKKFLQNYQKVYTEICLFDNRSNSTNKRLLRNYTSLPINIFRCSFTVLQFTTIVTTLLNISVRSSRTQKCQCRLADTSYIIIDEHRWVHSVHKNVYLISFQNFRRAISISWILKQSDSPFPEYIIPVALHSMLLGKHFWKIWDLLIFR